MTDTAYIFFECTINFLTCAETLYAFASGGLGFFVGFSELANRYRSFQRIFFNLNSWLYMLINFLAGVTAYVIVLKYKISLGSLDGSQIGKVIFCGLSAMAFLRSSFFSYKDSNGKSFEVGPAALLTNFSRVAETEFDQVQSKENMKRVEQMMKDLNFLSASKDLPLLILSSMRILNSDEQKLLGNEVVNLVNDNTGNSEEVKKIALGLILLKYAGLDLLQMATSQLRSIYNDSKKTIIAKISDITIEG